MNRSTSLIAVGVILCLLLSSLTPLVLRDIARAQPADSAWPMFGQNPQRTGQSPYHGTGSPVLKWSFTTGGHVSSSPAIGADGTVYVGSWDNKLYAINPGGTQKWSFTTGSSVQSSPAIGADGTVYVGSGDGKLYAINPGGTQKWSFTAGGSVYSSPAVGADGTIYVGSYDNKLYAINPEDGSQKWSFTTGGHAASSPAIGADGTVYIGASWPDNKLYAINPDGSQKWSFTTGGDVGSSPAIGADGTVYVGSTDDKLYAINPEDGSQKWSFTAGGSVYSSPAVGADSTIYFGSWDNKLYAINPDGSQKWSFTTGGDVGSSPAIGADGTIYVGAAWPDSKLYAIRGCGLAVSSTAGGSVVTPGEGEFTYAQDTVVHLVAEADRGYEFLGWTGDTGEIGDDSAAHTFITMRDDYSITANFAIMEYALTITSTGGGSVTGPGEGTFIYNAGTVVNLVAISDEHDRFVAWIGDIEEIDEPASPDTFITMWGNYSITAVFGYDELLALHDGWTLVSTGKWVDAEASSFEGTGTVKVVYRHDGTRFVQVTDLQLLEPVEAFFVRSDGNVHLCLSYDEETHPGPSVKSLVKGWNLVSSATYDSAAAVLSPLRYVMAGGQQVIGLATVVAQGHHNMHGTGFYLPALTDDHWIALVEQELDPFDGYWVYIYAETAFGVVPG